LVMLLPFCGKDPHFSWTSSAAVYLLYDVFPRESLMLRRLHPYNGSHSRAQIAAQLRES
jgi:hypothetical protein